MTNTLSGIAEELNGSTSRQRRGLGRRPKMQSAATMTTRRSCRFQSRTGMFGTLVHRHHDWEEDRIS